MPRQAERKTAEHTGTRTRQKGRPPRIPTPRRTGRKTAAHTQGHERGERRVAIRDRPRPTGGLEARSDPRSLKNNGRTTTCYGYAEGRDEELRCLSSPRQRTEVGVGFLTASTVAI